ncbi:hypothetical protein [Salmonella phage vB_SalS_ABTNLsp1]|nr:hypothetical protein [Salmonella phage vB_SalS_ABTNLsp1]
MKNRHQPGQNRPIGAYVKPLIYNDLYEIPPKTTTAHNGRPRRA